MIYQGNINDLKGIGGIYKILCLATGKFYIGSSYNLRIRYQDHCKHLRGNRHASKYMQHSRNKYGESSFEFSALEMCANDQLLAREQWYLDTLRPTSPEVGFNTCITAGSPLGIKHTPEQVEANRARNLARKFSEEEIRHLSKMAIELHSMDYEVMSPEGELFKGRNISEFARTHSLNESIMCRVVSGKALHYKGWVKPENFGKPLDIPRRQDNVLVSPEGTIHHIPAGTLPSFCVLHNLIDPNIRRVLDGHVRHAKRWTNLAHLSSHVTLVHETGIEETVCRYHCKPFADKHRLIRGNILGVMKGKRKTHKGWRVKSCFSQ